MKKTILALAFALALGITTVSAQNSPKPKKQQFSWIKLYMDEIGLSAETQVKIEAVKTANNAEMKVLREDSSISEEDKAVKMKDLGMKRGKAIYALLTPEEKAKAKEIMDRIKAENEATQ